MEFNKQQKLAIDTIDENVCVVAGAGTGKTAILTHRFINIIKNSNLSPKEALESILAITFTKKATQEMIERIVKELSELEKVDSKYQGILNYIPFMNISTIDSFCKNIVDENLLKIGLSTDYEMIENLEKDKLLEDTILNVLKAFETNEVYKEFMIINSFFRPKNLSEELAKVYNRIQSKGYDFDELYNSNILLNVEEMDIKIFHQKISDYYDYIVENKIVNGRNGIVKDEKKLSTIANLPYLKKEELLNSLLNLKKNILAIKKDTDENINYLNNLVNNQILQFEKDTLKFYQLINDILKLVDDNFRRKKLEEGKLEFNDLLYYTREIFKDKNILAYYKEKYKYIMIDEFQDTNQLQIDIFYALCFHNSLLDRKNLFVVGDPKQSIYGFRGSELSVFEKCIDDIKNTGGEIIILEDNYRSSEELIKYSNILFSNLMKEKYNPLNANYKGENKPVGFYNLYDIEYGESDVVAKIVLDLLELGNKPEDIAILFRATTRLTELENSLSKYNIPYVNPKSKSFYQKREIKDLVLFLKFLNSNNDSESLYGLLRSNLFMIEDDILYNLSVQSNNSLFENLKNYNGANYKLNFAREVLLKSVSLKNQTKIYDILNNLIRVTSYFEVLGTIKNTLQSVENVRKFLDIVLKFEESNNGFLNQFIDYIYQQENESVEEALVVSEKGAINLMTIHGSKGLEFKSVIFYDSRYPNNSKGGKILLDKDLGYGMEIGNTSVVKEMVNKKINSEDILERDRLLYVCVTRAKENFIFVSVKENSEDKSPNNSMLKILEELEDYKYNIVDSIEINSTSNRKLLKLTTNEEEIPENNLIKKDKNTTTSSITGYSIFNKCKREYFYKYKLGLNNLDILNDKYEDIKIDLLENENLDNFQLDPLEFGIAVHSFIENYNETEENFDELAETHLKNYGIYTKIGKDRLLKNFFNYKKLDIKGEKYFEFDFLIKLEEGYINGSIDELIISEDDIFIVDFKTNRSSNIEKLLEYYKNQIYLYSIAVNKIFKKRPKKSYIHFLEMDKIIEIQPKEYEENNLIIDLNYFLRFVTYNDSIDKYEKCLECKENCNFKNLCNKDLNG